MATMSTNLERNIKALNHRLDAPNGSVALSQDNKQEMLQAAKAIVRELEDPVATLMDIAMGPFMAAALRIAIGAGILDSLPSNGDEGMTVSEVQQRTKADQELIVRILRVLRSIDFVLEPQPGRYTNSVATSVLVAAAPVRAMATHFADHEYAPFVHMPGFLAEKSYQLPHWPERSAYQAFHNTDKIFYEILADDPPEREKFALAMAITKQATFRMGLFDFPDRLAASNDFEYGLVDIGGGKGQLLQSVREFWPHWTDVQKNRLLLQDRPENVANIIGKEAELGYHVQGHSYLDTQTAFAAAYIYRWVFMDHDDNSVARLLKALKPAFKAPKQQRLLIVENVLPSAPEVQITPMDAGLDMIMMCLLNSKLRTEEDYHHLLEKNGFRIIQVWKDCGGDKAEVANGRGGSCLIEAELAH